MNFFETIGISAGTAAVVAGGVAVWFGKAALTKLGIGIGLEAKNADVKARLGAELERTVLVDRVRFEHEYEIYKNAWAALYRVGLETLTLTGEAAKTQDPQLRQTFVSAGEAAFNKFYDLIEENQPFYPIGIYSALDSARRACDTDLDTYRSGQAPEGKEVRGAIKVACEAIRDRIAEVRVP